MGQENTVDVTSCSNKILNTTDKLTLSLMTALIEFQFLPPLEYFCAILKFENVELEIHEHYVKQGYRNRCYINTSQGVKMLTVPLAEKGGKILVKDVRIDSSTKWQNTHWRTLQSAYKSAPFFEHYEETIHKEIYKNHSFLIDLNRSLLSFCLKSLKSNLITSESVSYETEEKKNIKDLRSMIQAKKPYYQRSFYTPAVYQQVFGNVFVPNLSLIDLLFCEGPTAMQVIRSSQSI